MTLAPAHLSNDQIQQPATLVMMGQHQWRYTAESDGQGQLSLSSNRQPATDVFNASKTRDAISPGFFCPCQIFNSTET